MSKTFDQGRAEIAKLCGYFDTNLDAFHAPGVKEAQIRQNLIDPFFEALGWDVRNAGMIAPQYCDVITEPSLDVEGEQKAPDYAFRVGPLPKFYAEAKKCGVNIHADPAPAFQLRRYGWSGKVAVSILTDFEELGVYDCTTRPNLNDKASHGRILYFGCKEYPDRWRELWDVFSREAVWSGAFDQYAASKRKRGTSEVDVEFLKEIEGWRESLARNMALRNADLSSDDLNAAVQLTIDRIIFLRMAEDRGLEPYERLLKLCERPEIYARFMQDVCRVADDKYNSGLFHFHKEDGVSDPPDRITTKLTVDDKVFKPILQNLYFAHGSPYHFGVLPVEILGTVYERFLGKVIRLTAGHQAKIEEKPEVRKAGGVYYTPAYIVDYIVKETVGRQIEGQSPAQLAGGKDKATLRILDMACGSGSFLLGAYRCLVDYCLKWYIDHKPEANKKAVFKDPRSGTWRLTIEEKKRILTTHLFGVDIDPQAVEVSKLSLLLKALEGESDATLSMQLKLFENRALPNLSNNIKCGNSLIGSDYFTGRLVADPDEMRRVSPFDWLIGFPDADKFDCIIGNPPYDVLEKNRGGASWPHAALSEYVRQHSAYKHALGGKLNLFRFFIVRALDLARDDGRFGMIVPLALLADISCARSRRQLLLRTRDLKADCFPQKDNVQRRVFLSAKLSTVVLTGSVNGSDNESSVLKTRVYPWNSFSDAPRENVVRFADTKILDPVNTPVPLTDAASWSLCLKVHKRKDVTRLASVTDFEVTRGEINQTVYREFIGPEKQSMKRLVKGVEIGRFQEHATLKQGKREWLNEAEYRAVGHENLNAERRRIATQRITGVDERLRVVATIIDPRAYFADSTNSITCGANAAYSLEYLLGLLNSKLFQWRFKLTSTNNNVGTNELLAMPFRTIDFELPADKSRHDKMASLVNSALSLHIQISDAKSAAQKDAIQRQIEATDRAIDHLVYNLYGLTDDEIAVIEGKNGPATQC